MTDPAAKSPPNPGSDAAIAAGCCCPVGPNSYGAGVMESGLYIIAEGCPLHVVARDEEPEPEGGEA